MVLLTRPGAIRLCGDLEYLLCDAQRASAAFQANFIAGNGVRRNALAANFEAARPDNYLLIIVFRL
jgi:hypothetical protein